MERKKRHELDFEEYVRNVEPGKREKSSAWSAAIGLQQVDGLTPSKYLYNVARRNIEGDISFEESQKLIDSYYASKTEREKDDDGEEEADKVASRIAHILSEKSFSFSPSYLIAVHGRLFQGIYKFAGRIRDYDITKKEWVLNGDTVMYGAAFELKMALDYDFEQERNFSYAGLGKEQVVSHLVQFVSRLWQIHAFGEGNTRTTAVFTIKYLRSLGFKANNEIFAKHSWYFRNALVRANYRNVAKGVEQNTEYLEKFFRNLLLGENNELRNRYTHIAYKTEKTQEIPENKGIESENEGIELKNKGIESKNEGVENWRQTLEETVLAAKLNATRKSGVMKVLEKVEPGQVFGGTQVMLYADCQKNAATSILRTLFELGLTEKVTGHGKGKYRLKV